MTKYVTALGLALVLTVAGAIGLATRDDRPTASTVDGSVPSAEATARTPQDGLSTAVITLQDTTRKLPKDHRSWAALAIAYVDEVRTGGDPSLYDRADEAVAKAFEVGPTDNFTALSARATLFGARHDFTPALRDANAALAINPRDLPALSIKIDALTELGRFPEQLQALKEADRQQPSVAVAARYGYAFELRGDLPAAARVLTSAADGSARLDRAYLLTLLADVERLQGNLDRSDAHLTRALTEVPGYLAAMVSRARLLVARGDLTTALKTWEAVVERAATLDTLTELGELYLFLGRTAEANAQFARVQDSIDAETKHRVNMSLEIAAHGAEHGSRTAALTAAKAEWGRRKSLHVADALAWALHQSGNDAAALKYSRYATSLGTKSARFWIHRGLIEAALDKPEAAAHLRRGISYDPGYSPWQVARARTVLAGYDAR
ncbi:MAG: hypothetical protein NTV23_02215 [Propionibacteriales bacterium]|nr:hypothetical protein [Propionibacteriales bacterium]